MRFFTVDTDSKSLGRNYMTVEVQQPDVSGLAQDVPMQIENDDQKPVFNKHQVNDVVYRERARAYEKGKRDKEMEMQSMMSQSQDAPANPSQTPQSIGGMQQLTPDQIKQLISQEAPKAIQDHVQKLQVHQVATSFANKMEAAEAKYPGLRAQLNELDYSTIAPVIKMVNEMDNSADVMKELLDNPMKMGNLTTLVFSQPKLAEKAVQSLSNSVKQNEAAKQANGNQAQEPLSPINPSANAGMDNGQRTVSDFRKLFRR